MAFRTLPRPQFATLQSAVFPIYFGLQTALPVLVAITYPGSKTGLASGPSSLYGLVAHENRATTLLPIATMFAVGLANLLIIGPATARVKAQRNHQGKLQFKISPAWVSISDIFSSLSFQ